jgi:hypothetical protein
MLKSCFTAILLLFLIDSEVYPNSNHVVTHQRTTVITNPKTGENHYPSWGIFPSADKQIRRIILHLTLGTPDSMSTAHWDYLDNVLIRRKGGMNMPSLDYEIGRMLTPYGSRYTKGWQFEWQVDVTDFAPFLRDSVEIEYRHSGYEPDTVGWALTIDFEIIFGPEVVKPLGMKQLWKGNFNYTDTSAMSLMHIRPVEFESTAGVGFNRIRIQHTGHGMDDSTGCSEFCNRWRALYYDDSLVDHRQIWKDCGDNPLYPQGGTWIYDRGYWCPGNLQPPDIIDVITKSGKHKVSLKMQPYYPTGRTQAVENINAYLFQYGKPLAANDVAIEGVMVPNNADRFGRDNPAEMYPRISIHNLGSNTLKSLLINYGTRGFPMKQFEWKGSLGFNKTAEITLPARIDFNTGMNTFEVELRKPNGQTDAWQGDNRLSTTFKSPELMPKDMIVLYKTNNKPDDNTIFLLDAKLDTVWKKVSKGLNKNTIYQDTLHLLPGRYILQLSDTAGEGLEFWAEPDQGDGYLRLLDLNGHMVHCFQSDCGNGEKFGFIASETFQRDSTLTLYGICLYPRRINDTITLDVVADKPGKMSVLIKVDGKVLEQHDYQSIKKGLFAYNLAYLPKGRLVVEVLFDGISKFKGRVMR